MFLFGSLGAGDVPTSLNGEEEVNTGYATFREGRVLLAVHKPKEHAL